MEDFENIIPEDAEKILFVEDLVNHFFRETWFFKEALTLDTVGRYREFVYNAFNENMRKAVNFLMSQMSAGDCNKFEILEISGKIKRNIYVSLAKNLRKKYFSKGFDARKFLYYCVHLGNLGICYWSADIIEEPNLIVKCILDGFKEYDMNSGGWNLLNRIAEVYANMATNSDRETFFSSEDNELKEDYTFTLSPNQVSPATSFSSGSSSDEESVQDSEANGSYRVSDEFMIHILNLDDFITATDDWKKDIISILNTMKSYGQGLH